MTDVSIIIVNYKSWPVLTECLTSLKNISLRNYVFEVIVVDNNSQDGYFSQFTQTFPEFNFILNSGNYGFSQACNLGASKAQGTYFLFLNPDTIMSQTTLETLLDCAHKHSDYKLISCQKVNEKGAYEKIDKPLPSLMTLFGLLRAVKRNSMTTNPNQILIKNNVAFPAWLSGSLILMSQAWFEKIGGWNEDYWMYYEDVDLSIRTTQMNGKIVLINDVEIIHNHGGSTRTSQKIKALSKTEVIISRHVYVHNNFKGMKRILAQLILIISIIVSKTSSLFLSIFMCFIPKLRVNIYIFKNLVNYYLNALKNKTWLSQRSTNFRK